jgi:hypothetical protein
VLGGTIALRWTWSGGHEGPLCRPFSIGMVPLALMGFLPTPGTMPGRLPPGYGTVGLVTHGHGAFKAGSMSRSWPPFLLHCHVPFLSDPQHQRVIFICSEVDIPHFHHLLCISFPVTFKFQNPISIKSFWSELSGS